MCAFLVSKDNHYVFDVHVFTVTVKLSCYLCWWFSMFSTFKQYADV